MSVAATPPLIVLAGLPGVGKTRLLRMLAELGESVIDLERLANHSGSIFGGLGKPAQPSHAAFQRSVLQQWAAASCRAFAWTEDEGPFIGGVGVPPAVLESIDRAPIVEVRAAMDARVAALVDEYGSIPPSDLTAAVSGASARIGQERAARAIRAIRSGALRDAIADLLPYYDDAYTHRTSRKTRSIVAMFEHGRDNAAALAVEAARILNVHAV